MGDAIVLSVIAAASILAGRSLRKNAKKGGCSGCSGCCGSCSGCSANK